MQATVERFDPTTARGSVLTDAGDRLEFSHESFDGAHIRHLRPGQRVHVDLDTSGAVIGLRIF